MGKEIKLVATLYTCEPIPRLVIAARAATHYNCTVNSCWLANFLTATGGEGGVAKYCKLSTRAQYYGKETVAKILFFRVFNPAEGRYLPKKWKEIRVGDIGE